MKKKVFGWLVVLGAILAILYGGLRHGFWLYAMLVLILLGLLLALGWKKVWEGLGKIIEWIIDKLTGGGPRK